MSSPPKIKIHRGADLPNKYVWSPFVIKVELRHRLSRVPYSCGNGSPLTGPKGKIPWLEVYNDGKEPEVLADSSLISKTFIERGIFQDLNACLGQKEKAQDTAIRSMLEEKLFFINGRERWIDNYYTMRDYTMAKIPFLQRTILGVLAYRNNMQRFYGQGVGRYTDDELDYLRREVWESINGFLRDSSRNALPEECFWVLGNDGPTEADTTVFGFIVSTLVAAAGPKSAEMVKQDFPVAVEYATRIHRRFFPDYEIWA